MGGGGGGGGGGVGAVLVFERCLGNLTRFFKNFVVSLSYQITYKI